MAKSIVWAIDHQFENNSPLSVNVGSDEWNFRVVDLAKLVLMAVLIWHQI